MSSSGQRVVPSTLTPAASQTQTLNTIISVDCKNYTTTWTHSFGNRLIMAAQNWQIYKFKPYSTFPLLLPSNMKYPLCWPYANVLTTHSPGFCHSNESKVIIHDLFFFPRVGFYYYHILLCLNSCSSKSDLHHMSPIRSSPASLIKVPGLL